MQLSKPLRTQSLSPLKSSAWIETAIPPHGFVPK